MLIFSDYILDKRNDILGFHFFNKNPIEWKTIAPYLSRLAKIKSRIFINLDSRDVLLHLEGLSKFENIIIEFEKTTPYNLDVINKIHDAGLKVCLKDPVFSNNRDIWLAADYIKLDCDKLESKMEQAIKSINSFNGTNKIIVYNVASHSNHVTAVLSDAIGTSGPWLTKHANKLKNKTIDPTYKTILNLLNIIRENGDVVDIENCIKHDVNLGIRLLKYINSVSFGNQREITNYADAIIILGYDQLYKWVSMLLLNMAKDTAFDVLIRISSVRGRFCELVSAKKKDQNKDLAFLVGCFSLVNVIFNTDMATAVKELHVHKEVKDTLLLDQGKYFDGLQMIRGLEMFHSHNVTNLADKLDLTSDDVNEILLEAIIWEEEVNAVEL